MHRQRPRKHVRPLRQRPDHTLPQPRPVIEQAATRIPFAPDAEPALDAAPRTRAKSPPQNIASAITSANAVACRNPSRIPSPVIASTPPDASPINATFPRCTAPQLPHRRHRAALPARQLRARNPRLQRRKRRERALKFRVLAPRPPASPRKLHPPPPASRTACATRRPIHFYVLRPRHHAKMPSRRIPPRIKFRLDPHHPRTRECWPSAPTIHRAQIFSAALVPRAPPSALTLTPSLSIPLTTVRQRSVTPHSSARSHHPPVQLHPPHPTPNPSGKSAATRASSCANAIPSKISPRPQAQSSRPIPAAQQSSPEPYPRRTAFPPEAQLRPPASRSSRAHVPRSPPPNLPARRQSQKHLS